MDNVFEVADLWSQWLGQVVFLKMQMRIRFEPFKPVGNSTDIIIKDSYLNGRAGPGAVPVKRGLDEIVAEKSRATRNEHVTASQSTKFLREVGGHVLEIVFDDLLCGELLNLFGHTKESHAIVCPLYRYSRTEVMM